MADLTDDQVTQVSEAIRIAWEAEDTPDEKTEGTPPAPTTWAADFAAEIKEERERVPVVEGAGYLDERSDTDLPE